jgi:hypothetical protein
MAISKKNGAFCSRKLKKTRVFATDSRPKDFFNMLLCSESKSFTVPLDDDLIAHFLSDSSFSLTLEDLKSMQSEGYCYCPQRESFISPVQFGGLDFK